MKPVGKLIGKPVRQEKETKLLAKSVDFISIFSGFPVVTALIRLFATSANGFRRIAS